MYTCTKSFLKQQKQCNPFFYRAENHVYTDMCSAHLTFCLYFLNFETTTASSIALWYSAGFECGRSRIQSPVKDRVIPKTV